MPRATPLEDETLTVAPIRLRFGVDLREPKFSIPGARPQSVWRTELLARLERGRDRPVILVTAPAGYGKTTLLSQWAVDGGRPCAWVTLDQTDGEPDLLARAVADALARTGIQPDQTTGFGLVLDDADRVAPKTLDDELRRILSWLPDGAQVALGCRRQPALALGRMQAARMVIELGSGDLAMTAAETAFLLRGAGLDPAFVPVQALVRRTEGWPVALEFATARWAARRPADGSPRLDVAESEGWLNGDDHLMSEYFRGEVLASLSPAALRFLTRTSALDRLSGPLCDAVLGHSGSARMLAQLARANVPLQALDASHEWYRLNGLFGEMLQTELRRSEPDAALLAHRRAATWYREAGDIDRALDHARWAEDLTALGELLWSNLPRYLRRGRNDLVQGWLRGIAADGFTGSAPLALAAAHSELALGNVAVAEQWARCAVARLPDDPEDIGPLQRAGALIIQAWAGRSGVAGMAELASRGYHLLPDDSSWRAICCFLRGTAGLLAGDLIGAERLLAEGADRGAVLAPDAAGLCLAQLAVLAAERGRAVVASDFAWRAHSVAVENGPATAPSCALVFAVCAAAAMREGRVDEAKAAASDSLRLLGRFDDTLAWYGAETRILVARTSLALGDVAQARELLADASRLARRVSDGVIFARWFEDAWDQFDQRAEGALAGIASLTTAELRVLRFLPTHYSFQEIAQRLHVSSNTVKTHVHAVYRKLNASSRSEAVRQARDAGLLGG